MNPGEIEEINRLRLRNWAYQLQIHHATPLVLLGIGHDHMAGTTHILMPDNLPREIAINALKSALIHLQTEEG